MALVVVWERSICWTKALRRNGQQGHRANYSLGRRKHLLPLSLRLLFGPSFLCGLYLAPTKVSWEVFQAASDHVQGGLP